MNVQGHLILWFYCIEFRKCCIFFFYRLKVCGDSASSKSVDAIFVTAFAHFVSLGHILFLVFIYLFILRERIYKLGRGREKERQSPKQVLCHQQRAHCGAQTHKL